MASFGAPLTLGLAAQSLGVRLDGDDLRIVAPQFHFLTGKSLEKLKDGASVAFLAQLSLSPEVNAPAIKRAVDRFIVSYDVWEEKFSVTQTGMERAKVTHLSSTAAEAWCLDEPVSIPPALSPARPFWIKLELRTEDPKESAAIVGEPGISLRRLVEIFSRPPRNQQQWLESQGPLRLQDL